MSDHHESNTPRIMAYLAFAIVVIFIAALAYKMFIEPSFTGQNRSETESATQESATEQSATPDNTTDEFAPLSEGDVAIELTLEDGPVVIRLRPDLAPQHVEQIVALTEASFYDDIVFHRVIDGFMAQTGDPTGTGMGGSDLPDLPAEFSDENFGRGVVGMARSQSPDSANSQFFIMLAPAPHLNGQYTKVGEVVSGMEFVDAIEKGAPEANGTVQNPDKIVSLKVM